MNSIDSQNDLICRLVRDDKGKEVVEFTLENVRYPTDKPYYVLSRLLTQTTNETYDGLFSDTNENEAVSFYRKRYSPSLTKGKYKDSVKVQITVYFNRFNYVNFDKCLNEQEVRRELQTVLYDLRERLKNVSDIFALVTKEQPRTLYTWKIESNGILWLYHHLPY
jgi:hypothetical protein